MENKSIVEAADKIAGIFSPFKTIYFGFIALLIMKKIHIECIGGFWGFAGISFVIMGFEIFHNDFLRRKLNKWSE